MPKAGKYDGSRTGTVKTEKIVNALAIGQSKISIARDQNTNTHTVTRIALEHAGDIAQRKAVIRDKYERIIADGLDQLHEQLARGKFKGGSLIAAVGMSTDKYIALNPDPVQVQVQHTLEPSQKLYEQLNAIAERLEVNVKQSNHSQSFLPDIELKVEDSQG